MAPSILPGVAFVTGGARGLGNDIAVAFAREGCPSIVIVDILPDEEMEKGRREVEKHNAQCLAIRCDVSKEREVQDAIAQTVAKFGRLDYAANFAGISGPTTMIEAMPVEKFEQCLRVNTTGVWLCTKHQILQMSKQEPQVSKWSSVPQRGAIVNCASVNSILSGVTTAAYTASKHAVVGLTKTAALEARSQHIRVNSLSPGFIWTDMIEKNMHSDNSAAMRQAWESWESRQGRKAFPAEIANATVLLCSHMMSLVNAHNLVCDNGFTVNENGI